MINKKNLLWKKLIMKKMEIKKMEIVREKMFLDKRMAYLDIIPNNNLNVKLD